MDLQQKIRTLPTGPGCYLYKNAEGEVIYVGKAKNLRARVRSYFLAASQANAKTGSLMREAVDLEYITVANEHEALALENNLIKQRKPRFNILLRDDKTYPYIKLTLQDRHPKVFVTRRLRKDGGAYFGPYFPGNLAHRLVDVVHRSFLVPSCKVDLTRFHPRPCLQYHIKRCLGPCVQGLTTPEQYSDRVAQVRLLLEGRAGDLVRSLHQRMTRASEEQRFEEAARLRDQIRVVEEVRERQKMAALSSQDADIFGFHQEGPLVAVNLFHLRGGRVVDRREFFWEDVGDFNASEFFSSLLKQLYLDQQHLPREIHIPVDFEDRSTLEEMLSEKCGAPVRIFIPQAGSKRSMMELVARNARHSFDRRFRILKPAVHEMLENLAEALDLPRPPRRIEAFDVSHIQGSDIVASMVVWEDGTMKKSDYRKFIVKSVPQND